MVGMSYEQTTESHLAKKYNDIVYDCMMRANLLGYAQESKPHIDNLMPYAAAVHVLYRNTFMLFYSVKMGNSTKKIDLANILYDKIKYVKEAMRAMKRNRQSLTNEYFESIEEQCHIIQMLINDGLQSLNMLVRMGQSEPRGEESVQYWDDKVAFKKGGLKDHNKKNVGMFLQ